MATECVVCGSCVIDILCRPVDLTKPIGDGVLYQVDPIEIHGGGITSNSGITLARLGISVAALSYIGRDAWAPVIRNLYESEGIDCAPLLEHPTAATSTTVVVIDATGERSFYHCVGAPKLLDARTYLDHLDVFAGAKMMLMGYYSLMPNLEDDLPDVLAAIRKAGCKTALDAAGTGGDMQPLDRILPHLDVYVPSFAEAQHQTGLESPEKIIDAYRDCGAPGLLGVKLGSQGVMLSPEKGRYITVPVVPAPGEVIDTTGAGDSFYAGLLAGLIRGLSIEDAGRLGAAAGACCVTSLGGCTGGRDWPFTAKLAGIA